jgi:hypothetical protein
MVCCAGVAGSDAAASHDCMAAVAVHQCAAGTCVLAAAGMDVLQLACAPQQGWKQSPPLALYDVIQ